MVAAVCVLRIVAGLRTEVVRIGAGLRMMVAAGIRIVVVGIPGTAADIHHMAVVGIRIAAEELEIHMAEIRTVDTAKLGDSVPAGGCTFLAAEMTGMESEYWEKT